MLRAVLGLEVCRSIAVGALVKSFLHQRGYMETICHKFVEELGRSSAMCLKPISTPAKTKPDISDEEKALECGFFKGTAPVHVGRVLWALRRTRPDVSVALYRLSKRVKKWTKREDDALLRLYRYLWGTRYLGLWFTVNTKELGSMGTDLGFEMGLFVPGPFFHRTGMIGSAYVYRILMIHAPKCRRAVSKIRQAGGIPGSGG